MTRYFRVRLPGWLFGWRTVVVEAVDVRVSQSGILRFASDGEAFPFLMYSPVGWLSCKEIKKEDIEQE